MEKNPAISTPSVEFKPLWKGFHYELHQTVGIHWLLSREAAGRHGGLLCDEMGLGKTIQIVGLLRSSPLKFNLIILPLPVLEQWRETATKARINCWVFENGDWKAPKTLFIGSPCLYIVNYEMVTRKPAALSIHEWDRVFCDEAHRLASGGSAWTAVEKISATYKWLLTATPIVNSISDIKNLFKLFKEEFNETKIHECILARSMEDMRAKLPHLPKKAEEEIHMLDFESEEEADFYRGIQGMLVKRWRALDTDSGATALVKLRLIMRLRQLSLHPQVYIESQKKQQGGKYGRADWIDPSTKFNSLLDLIEKETTPRRWIVFCHFRQEMELLNTFLQASDKISHVWRYSGDTKKQDRKKILAETHTPLHTKSQVLLIQLQAGGTGLNLQHFSRIAFTGPWWTAALMNQAIGRAVRIGQKEQVVVHHLLLNEEAGMNIDDVMMEKAELKGDLCASVLGKANHTIHM